MKILVSFKRSTVSFGTQEMQTNQLKMPRQFYRRDGAIRTLLQAAGSSALFEFLFIMQLYGDVIWDISDVNDSNFVF